MVSINGTVFFSADDGVHGRELWVSDGSASGTTMLRDYEPGSGCASWTRIVAMNGEAFFTGYDGVHGYELWKSDGTQANTAMVMDVTPGNASTPDIEFLGKGHGLLFFSADDGTHGYELWQTDGTEGGTRLVYDLWPGSFGSWPREAMTYGDVLLFTAETESTGFELWKLKLPRRDGVSKATEDAAPNGGDGNRDGTLDSLQANVTSLPNAGNAQYVTLESPGGTKLLDVTATKNPSPTNVPPGVSFPIGFLEYQVANVVPGGATTVTITVPTGATPTTYWKYGPTPGNLTPYWYQFSYDGTTGAELFDDRIVLHLVDGLRGDADLTADGAVVTNGVPAMPAVNIPPLVNPDVFTLSEDGQFTPAFPGLLDNDSV